MRIGLRVGLWINVGRDSWMSKVIVRWYLLYYEDGLLIVFVWLIGWWLWW